MPSHAAAPATFSTHTAKCVRPPSRTLTSCRAQAPSARESLVDRRSHCSTFPVNEQPSPFDAHGTLVASQKRRLGHPRGPHLVRRGPRCAPSSTRFAPNPSDRLCAPTVAGQALTPQAVDTAGWKGRFACQVPPKDDWLGGGSGRIAGLSQAQTPAERKALFEGAGKMSVDLVFNLERAAERELQEGTKEEGANTPESQGHMQSRERAGEREREATGPPRARGGREGMTRRPVPEPASLRRETKRERLRTPLSRSSPLPPIAPKALPSRFPPREKSCQAPTALAPTPSTSSHTHLPHPTPTPSLPRCLPAPKPCRLVRPRASTSRPLALRRPLARVARARPSVSRSRRSPVLARRRPTATRRPGRPARPRRSCVPWPTSA